VARPPRVRVWRWRGRGLCIGPARAARAHIGVCTGRRVNAPRPRMTITVAA